MGACGAFQVARTEVRGGMLCVRACRRAPPAVCMPKRPRIRSARAGQRPAPRHHQGEGPTAKSGRDGALARARDTVKCCQNPGQVKSEPRSDRIRTGGQMNRNPHGWRCRQHPSRRDRVGHHAGQGCRACCCHDFLLETGQNVRVALTEGRSGWAVFGHEEMSRILDSPANKRLERLFLELNDEERIDLLALGWLGQGRSGTEWEPILERAFAMIDGYANRNWDTCLALEFSGE